METPYVRFVLPVRHRDSGHAVGLFQFREHTQRRELPLRVRVRIGDRFGWFAEHLAVPPVVKRETRGLSWFRADAGEPLRRARLLVTWLRSQGVPLETVQSREPGRVLYRDEHQVVAVPGWDTYTGRVGPCRVVVAPR